MSQGYDTIERNDEVSVEKKEINHDRLLLRKALKSYDNLYQEMRMKG